MTSPLERACLRLLVLLDSAPYLDCCGLRQLRVASHAAFDMATKQLQERRAERLTLDGP